MSSHLETISHDRWTITPAKEKKERAGGCNFSASGERFEIFCQHWCLDAILDLGIVYNAMQWDMDKCNKKLHFSTQERLVHIFSVCFFSLHVSGMLLT